MDASSKTHRMILAELRSSGRLWSLDFRAGAGRPLGEEEISDPGADWNWSHFALSDQRSRLFIERLDLPSAVRATLLGGETRVQIQVDGDWSYGVLPDYEHEFDGRTTGADRLNFAFDGRRLLTSRRHPLHVVDCLRREVEKGAVPLPDPIEAIVQLVTGFVDAAEEQLIRASAELDHAEDAVLAEHDVETLRIGAIRRALSGYHREFAALRSAFAHAGSRRNAARGGPLIERIQPVLLEVEDFDRDVAGLQDRARLLHDEIESRVSAAVNRSLRVLTVLTTLLMPPTLIAGAFGMNLQGIPFADSPMGFAAASLLCIAVVVVCAWALWKLRVFR